MGALVVLANAALLRFYLSRRDPGWLDGDEFEGLRCPSSLSMVFVLAGAAVALPAARPAAYNVLLVLAFFFALQGLAVASFYARRLAAPPFLRAAVVRARAREPLGAADPGAHGPVRHLARFPQVGPPPGGPADREFWRQAWK